MFLAVLVAVEPAGAQLPLKCNGFVVTIRGTQEADRIVGTPGDDVIHGLGGNDVIHGLGGNDVICGGTGRDRILGGSGSDRILGNEGRDKVRGGPGRDTLFGGDSHDRLSGGPGADRLDGGNGNDVLKGGKGDDSLDGRVGFDRCVGDAGLDGSGRCEEALTDLQAWTVEVGGASVYIVASEPSLTGITEITESGWIVEKDGQQRRCQEFTWYVGEVPECVGPALDGFVHHGWQDEGEFRITQRTITMTWPPVDGVSTVVRHREWGVALGRLTNAPSRDFETQLPPVECRDLRTSQLVSGRTFVNWGAENPAVYGKMIRLWGTRNAVPILQVKMSEAEAAALRQEFLDVTGRIACIETVNFTQREIFDTLTRVQRLDDSLPIGLDRRGVGVSLKLPDVELIDALVEAAGDRADLLEVVIETAYRVGG